MVEADDRRREGERRNACPNGDGVSTYPDGTHHEGGLRNGHRLIPPVRGARCGHSAEWASTVPAGSASYGRHAAVWLPRRPASTGDGSGFVHGRPPSRPVRPGPERHVVAAARGRADPSLIRFGLRPRDRSVTPVPFLIGRDVPHGGTLSMRRRVSARLAFGHTPARPFFREGRAFPHLAHHSATRTTTPFGRTGSALVASPVLSASPPQGDGAFRANSHRGAHRDRQHSERPPERRGCAFRAIRRRLRRAPRHPVRCRSSRSATAPPAACGPGR